MAVERGGAASEAAPVTRLLNDVTVVHSFSLSPGARAAGTAGQETVSAEDDDVLELNVDGFTLWTSVRRYADTLRVFRPDAVVGDTVVVDSLPSADAARGEDLGASAVRVLRVAKGALEAQLSDPGLQQEFFQDFGLRLVERGGSWMLAKALIWLVERQLRPREGVYSWAQATRPPQPGGADPAPVSFDRFDITQPILLFLHGTGSSTLGSFGEFTEKGSADQLKELTDYFKTNIYAFEHKTLSRSPIENALAVAQTLPARASLYLVSHSRGGMIGDLLCLPTIDPSQINAFGRHGEFDAADSHDRDNLRQLSELLAQKQFRVQRFARAACPARGTLLASENIDQFLSTIAYLLDLIPTLKVSPVYEVVKRVALETVHRRWEPGMLPGLEAMTPESPLVRLLNESTEATGSLGVIAGDIQGGNWFKRFGVFISDRMLYDNRDNDLVVNTDSMFLGAARTGGRYVFDQGADVSHFNYFKNRRTRARVAQWMTVKDENALADFRDLEEAKVEPIPMQREAGSRASTVRPIVVLVPDLFGSDLYDGGERIWLDREALASGHFGRLGDLSADSPIRTKSVLGEHYEPLRAFLSNTHDVIPFPYDWRLSTTQAADALAARIAEVLDETRQPVRILGHGAGGLVVRQWIARDGGPGSAWARLCGHSGGRVVLLGTPHKGSYEAVELVLGTHPLAQQLALLDRRLGPKGVVELLQTFPGVLELLPSDDSPAFFDPDTWRPFAPSRRGAALPDGQRLSDAKAVCGALASQRLEPGRVLNVVGTAARTVCGVEPGGQTVTLLVTTEGDGRVPHDSGAPTGLVTWYADAAHGELASDSRVFPAILSLLESGEARQLPTVAPSRTRARQQVRRTPPERVLYPSAPDLLTGIFGRRAKRVEQAPRQSGFRVSVVHGDLTFARYPIVVGHYENDTIIGAEAVVDRLFDGALTTRYNLGLYPGQLGTFSIVFREPTPLQRALQLPSGAVVVGLGRWGELTAGQIANIVRRAALEYILQLDNQPLSADRGGGAPTGSRDTGLSVLLIGSNTSNISTQDSVAAILRGIAQANLELKSIDNDARIGTIEIVELYVDTAIEAARAAKHLAATLGDELRIRIDAEPFLQRGRQGRVRFAAVRNADAWRRWEITAEPSQGAAPRLPQRLRAWLDATAKRADADPALLAALAGMALPDAREASRNRLRFVSLSDRARAEVMMEQHQPVLIERLIQSAIGDTRFNPEAARALFELMVPNDLKDGLGQLSNVVFVLDAKTSTFPWELMTDSGDRPLSTRVRMVRQLQSATFRPHIRTTTGPTAYVVGDPRVTAPFKQLPGARAEAEAVAETLKAAGFEPAPLTPEATALDVLGGLFARPYRIVHLAGHGHYEPESDTGNELSGMVLDNGVFLTAAEVRKMAQVPELVFLNCCSIGQIGPDAVEPVRDVAFNRLAASISRELIEMGVRAVVAAGWAVRDDAALFFARTFYDEMLRGETFGRALCTARERTWLQFRDANTWGAYQAYGDPDFRLTKDQGSLQKDDRVAPEELLEQIDRVWRRARRLERELDLSETPGDQASAENARTEQVAILNQLLLTVPDAWLKRSDVRVAIGEAFGELAQFPSAIEQLEAALDTGELDSKTTIKAAEALLNFSTRQAASEHNEDNLRRAIERLEAMQTMGRTAERWSLLGGAYKRLANLLADANDAKNALESAATMYKRAHDHNVQQGKFDHYPVVNWVALEVVLGRTADEFESLLRDAELNAQERFVRDRSARDAVFSAVAPADISVVRAIAAGTFSDAGRTQAIDDIVNRYRESFRRVQGTYRQRRSVTDQLSALEGFVTRFSPAGIQPVQDALKEIRDRL